MIGYNCKKALDTDYQSPCWSYVHLTQAVQNVYLRDFNVLDQHYTNDKFTQKKKHYLNN